MLGEKIVKSLGLPIALTFCLASCIAVAGAISSRAVNAQTRCNPIGRIVSGSGENFSQGQIICAGDRLVSANNVQMLCFNNRAIIRFEGVQTAVVDSQTCGGGSVVATEPCQPGQTTRCFRPRGPGEGDFQLIEPSQTTVTEDRPRITWEAVEGATQYTVRVSGTGVSWERSLESTELDYPQDESALQSGNAYRIVVIARLPDRNMTAFTVVNRVTPDQAATGR